ncbi:MAG: hypothetical protein HOC33_15260 [Alphaproteobacteria bacterium]|nr:hypothetical protein [Alphaproteobacteria bacterium]MBT4545211.1 hypothetical protein [Alphaproteobacteria bacterium]
MSYPSSSTRQTLLSLTVTALLAGVLIWQLKTVPEEAQPVQSAPQSEPETESTAEATTPKQTAVVMLPPPPVAATEAPEIEPVTSVVEPLQPRTPPVIEEKQAAITTPLQPIKKAPANPVLDLLAERPVLKPAPEPQPSIKPIPKPVKKISQKPAPVLPKSRPVTRNRPAPQQPVQHASKATTSTGRALLRVLEHGKGPTVQISWPEAGRARSELSRQLRQCFGMQLALMDQRGQLYVAETRRGEPWRPNRDFYSGFVRQTAGQLPQTERETARQIRRRHGSIGNEVHIFPRRVDALMLGALQNLVGDRYNKARMITARYELTGSRLRIGGLRVDGETVQGVIDLSGVRHCASGYRNQAT